MFEALQPLPEDKILGLMKIYKADTRANKIDLGVGVYKDASGHTPIMTSVKRAEKLLWESEDSKSYTALAGEAGYHQSMTDLVLADAVSRDRVAALHTPGGTGAIRQILELVKMASPEATIWYSDPTWANHPAMVKFLGLKGQAYRYIDPETQAVDFENMLDDLRGAKTGDVIILHGCCHNPTGANLKQSQWKLLAELMESKGLMPFVDLAYQGFGDGLQEDAWATRMLAARFPEMVISASCSKNFGIYRERTGMVLAISKDAKATAQTQQTLGFINRQNYSFPPDHGARLVTMVLQDAALRKEWEDELEAIRTGMLKLRGSLAEALRQETSSDRFGFIAEHRGMFSRIGATPEQVLALRDKFGIYIIGDSRLNIAGLNEETIPIFAKAVVETGV